MATNTKIDILLPYWGDVELFKLAIESVFAQTEANWRLIIVDDHYPTLDAKEYIESLHDDRVEFYRHKENIGITKNFNFCLEKASAPFCIIFGCDDIMLPNYLERALKMISKADFYQPNVNVIDKNGNVYKPIADRIKHLLRPKKQGIYKGEKLASSLCHGNWLYFPSIVWRTNSIQRYEFDETYKVVEDFIVEMNLLKDGGTLMLDNQTTFQYRRFADSVSSKEKMGSRFREEAEAYKKIEQDFREIGWNKASLSAKLRFTSRLHQILS